MVVYHVGISATKAAAINQFQRQEKDSFFVSRYKAILKRREGETFYSRLN